ncbi:MAG: YlxR family protein [Cyanobacteria bacterium M_surface_7_m2_040]|nr:YlxR family protein [Cyanobacteria bacterium K_Offshore_0m_m2_072]MBM5809543.1 YlxR family protein [Cyanobacteria bacterium M_surface_9_m1_291]MBM5827138.1 YlxR family protein [Cyanobacteria bacterium M_surface_7_m2_040]
MSAKVVLRRCVACRQLLDREQLWRVIRLAEGGVVLDQGQGRSAYLCPTAACLDDARRHKRLQRALRGQVADSILKRLESRLSGNADACTEAR